MNKRLNVFLVFFLAVLFCFFQFSSVIHVVDLKSLDLFRTPHVAHQDIVILAIDNKSLQEVGRWPWSRSVHAELLNKLIAYQPYLVGYDVTFSDKTQNSEDAQLAKSLTSVSFPVILTSQALYNKGEAVPFTILQPLSEFRSSKNIHQGHANIFLSEDGLARVFPETLTYRGVEILPFSFVVTTMLNASTPKQNALVSFAGPSGSFQTVSVSDVLKGRIHKEQLDGKIVLIGSTASDLRDVLLVPGSRQILPGVEYHANIIDNILLKRYITQVPQSISRMVGVVIFIIFLLLFYKVPSKLTLTFLIALLIALPVTSFIFWQQRYAFSYAANTFFVGSLIATSGLYRWYTTEREKRVIKATFQNYFSPQILDHILTNPELLSLGGKKAVVSILFSDIRGFTTISEQLEPEQLTQLLNEYFSEMTEEIFATDGAVDKFIGDAIMAFWGAPISQKDSADRAVKAAIGMVQRLKKLQQKWKDEGLPVINIGIGINTGEVTVGNMGSSKRFDYTIIGDDVNVASRLEGLTKEYSVPIIISEATKKMLTIKNKTKHLGKTKVKGKSQSVSIYTVEL